MSDRINQPREGVAARVPSRDGRTLGRDGRTLAALGAALAMTVCAGYPASGNAAQPQLASVIVREAPGAGDAPERAVRRLGGTVERQLSIINGFSAKVPAAAVARLRTARGVLRVTVNTVMRPTGLLPGTSYEQTTTATSIYSAMRWTDADEYWQAGYTGKGVDVALIDTGVAKVQGLDSAGKVLDGPDLSFESQDPSRAYRDNFGHGTHLAGIIAGNDIPGSTGRAYFAAGTAFLGIAPDARVINMKVGDGNGVTDVSQVIASLDWIVQHRNTDGLNIRVIELAFGTDSTNPANVDPLTFAFEQAWKQGIVVVVSAGNGGKNTQGPGLATPATSPTLLAVGAVHPGTSASSQSDDTVASFSSSKGLSGRGPDLVTYGVSLPSLRAPGSKSDTLFGATGGIGPRFIKGSGSSQASAVAAGAVALVIQKYPTATPDQIKAMLMANTHWIASETAASQGAGQLDLDLVPDNGWGVPKNAPKSSGLGSLDASRGTRRPTLEGVEISGEVDIQGAPFDPATWTPLSSSGRSWSGGDWNGRSWSGRSWSGSSWTGSSWTGSSWTGSSWTGSSWTGSSWTGVNFLGSSWSTAAWN
jgi:serine protease AprX